MIGIPMAPAPGQQSSLGRGLAWISLGSGVTGVLDLAAQVLLLHYFLSPAEYGVAALAVTLFPLLDQAADLGLSAAVIQRDDPGPDELATVFWLNLGLAALLFGLVALVAPRYAAWQGQPVVGAMLLVYGARLALAGVYQIPFALLRRALRFKEVSIIRIVANLVEFAGKVGGAAAGLGVWCFVVAALARVGVIAVGAQLCQPYRPRLVFRPRAARDYLGFGLSTQLGQLLYTAYSNADYPVVNRLFGATALGLYRAAYELVLELTRTISSVFTEVAFPAFARLRHERARLVEQFVAFTRQSLVALLPVLVVLFVAAPEALTVAWGEPYAAAATSARVLCAVGLLRALGPLAPALLDGMGHPRLGVAYHATAALVLPLGFVVAGTQLGPALGATAVAVGWAVAFPVAFAVLLGLALGKLGLAPRVYLRRLAGVVGCAVLAAPVGALAYALGAGAPPLVRLVGVALAVLAAFMAVLDRLAGIRITDVLRALR
jgi:O-antigen/teichoic acid export membrane protein